MSPLKISALIALLASGQPALPAMAADSAAELNLIGAEVAARRLIREHESGVKRASETELAAARAVVRQGEERRARQVAAAADGGFKLDWENAAMGPVAHACERIFGGEFVVSEKLKLKRVTIKVASPDLDAFRAEVRSTLAKQGVVFRVMPWGIILEAGPEKGPK